MDYYERSIDHLLAELARLDVLLQRELSLVQGAESPGGEEQFRGLVITEGEIAALVGQPDFLGERWRHEERLAPVLARFDERAAAMRHEIDEKCARSAAHGIDLALPAIGRRAALNVWEVDILLVAIAPELERNYDTLYGYLQNDVTRKRPSIDLALNLVARSAEEKLWARRLLSPAAPLLRRRLLTLGEEAHDHKPSTLRRFLKCDEAVTAALLDQPAAAVDGAQAFEPAADPPPLALSDSLRDRLARLVARLSEPTGRTSIVRIRGASGPALQDIAEWIAANLRRRLLVASVDGIHRERDYVATVVRQAMLGRSILALAGDDDGRADARPPGSSEAEQAAWREIAPFDDLVLLLGDPSFFGSLPAEADVWHVEVADADFDRRREQWRTALANGISDQDASALADSFRLGRPDIRRTVSLATSLARLREPGAAVPARADLFEAGRVFTTPELRRFAVRVEPRYEWKDIVLPSVKREQLQRISSWKRLRHQVHEGWGFGLKLVRGGGLHGPVLRSPGTGKTMAAEVLARDLCLDLYRIDLSCVISKYIGETEQHLGAIFTRADDCQCILFFDEADALFGKRIRGQGRARSLRQHRDQLPVAARRALPGHRDPGDEPAQQPGRAFLRRLNDVVEFPFPDAVLREQIWRGLFPRDDIYQRDVDFPFLAKMTLTGSSIRNIVLDAAFRAADAHQSIGMRHLMSAAAAELGEARACANRARFRTVLSAHPPQFAADGARGALTGARDARGRPRSRERRRFPRVRPTGDRRSDPTAIDHRKWPPARWPQIARLRSWRPARAPTP